VSFGVLSNYNLRVRVGVQMLKYYSLLILYQGNSVVKVSRGDEVLQYKMPFINEVEHEERRMSDLSDWASSVTSAADMQVVEDSETEYTFYRFFTGIII